MLHVSNGNELWVQVINIPLLYQDISAVATVPEIKVFMWFFFPPISTFSIGWSFQSPLPNRLSVSSECVRVCLLFNVPYR